MQQLTSILPIAATLFAFWILLSGKFDAAHLGAGAAAAIVVGFSAARLWTLPPPLGAGRGQPFAGLRWGRAAAYGAWLVWQIIISGLQVAYVVLHPRMPIAPRLLRVRTQLPHVVARLTLANSITLTPGTVTLDVEGDELLVHALTPATGSGVEAGRIRNRVALLFEDPLMPPAAGDRS